MLLVPLEIVTFVSVTLPRLVTVFPRETDVLPIVTELFARKLLGMPEATLLIVTLARATLASVVTVFPSVTDVVPIVTGVAKFVSNSDSGIDDVALANV
jgi:hypothetical protein